MKKILVIGAGIGQYYLVQKAQKMGLYVIVVSPKGNYPAITIADELYECDIYDRDSIVEFARLNSISAVISDQNDLMMPTVAYVAEKLGLPGNTFKQVASYCDKDRFREICRQIGNPVPNYICLTTEESPIFEVPFPWIVKPVDSQSSIGITKVKGEEEVKDAINVAFEKSKQHRVIVEQFFKGKEYVCEGFVYHGVYYNLSFGDRIYFKNIKSPIPCQTQFPSSLPLDVQDKIIQCEQRFTSYVKASFGIVHSEYLVNDDGDFCVVESAIRGGGVYISSHLIPLSTGIDINTLLLKCALGESLCMEKELGGRINQVAAYICFTLPCGIITEIKGLEELKNINGVKMVDIRDMQVGDLCNEMTSKGMRKGPIIVSANTNDELLNIIEKVHQTLKVSVKTTLGIKNIIWD